MRREKGRGFDRIIQSVGGGKDAWGALTNTKLILKY